MVTLRFLNFYYWKENPKFLRIAPVARVPPFEKHCNIGRCSGCDIRVHFAEIVIHSAFKKKENEDFVFEMHVREVRFFKDKRL